MLMEELPIPQAVSAGFTKAGIESAQKHVFVCIGPDCCSSESGELLWECIKRRVKESGVRVMRTKARCFRICSGGPWLVVYPEGIWYGEVTMERFNRICDSHIVGGNPVEEWVVARNSLGSCSK